MPESFYQVIWIWLIYAFIGWCMEVAYAAVTLGQFVNRGFLNGPFCPIYGFGMLIVISCLWKLRGNLVFLFLGAALLTTVLEFVTGFVLEKFFHQKWWDYSEVPFNIKGYICLKGSIIWGLAATFVVGAVHPFIMFIIKKFPFVPGVVLLILFGSLFISDFVITLVALSKLPAKLKAVAQLERILTAVSGAIGGNISGTAITAATKGSDFLEEKKPLLEHKKDELMTDFENKREEYEHWAEEKKTALEKKLSEYRSQISGKRIYMRISKAYPKLKSGVLKSAFERRQEKENEESDEL